MYLFHDNEAYVQDSRIDTLSDYGSAIIPAAINIENAITFIAKNNHFYNSH